MKRRNFLYGVTGLGVASALAGCAGGDNAPWEPAGSVQASEYRLGSGDDLRVIVFGQQELSGDFKVDGAGQVSFPLIGELRAAGLTARELEAAVQRRLADGYVRDPRVSVQVTTARPFFIVGEVRQPGQYPYTDGMTAIAAIAKAGGHTYRARQDYVLITRGSDPQKVKRRAPMTAPVFPDDVVEVPERFF
ncbi:MAG TPA: polysaccharide biosynthesis/export family protein [Azospirillaceae bacterium]|nr:polysaccharide biosynthesis/export family protein [Azospirillaceae bacterium]